MRPDPDEVATFLAAPSEAAWRRFSKTYRAMLVKRFDEDSLAFDTLADLAREQNVWLGCNCPTQKNPDVRRCHTFLALEFMAERYADLTIDWPG